MRVGRAEGLEDSSARAEVGMAAIISENSEATADGTPIILPSPQLMNAIAGEEVTWAAAREVSVRVRIVWVFMMLVGKFFEVRCFRVMF